jgi:hypothetical protein
MHPVNRIKHHRTEVDEDPERGAHAMSISRSCRALPLLEEDNISYI